MAEIDYLNQRTTNVNIRISPMLKTQLIDSGARQGLNLSDYIMHLLITEMSGGNETNISDFEEYNELVAAKKKSDQALESITKDRDEIKAALERYYDALFDYRKYAGQTIIINGERFVLEYQIDLLKAILKTIKIHEV
jgi:hypothetical protein